MQLDLFEDNRPGILLNNGHHLILARDLPSAAEAYQRLLAEYPDDLHARDMLKLISGWMPRLPSPDSPDITPDQLHQLWLHLDSLSHPALRSTVLEILHDAMNALPDPEHIYRAPRFHLGQILMECGRFANAASCFQSALSIGDMPRGKFLAWRGDALTRMGSDEQALGCYLSAFLDDPWSVDMQSIKNGTIVNLHTSLCIESADEMEEEETPEWLPVWGWLHDVFPLPQYAAATDIPNFGTLQHQISGDTVTRGRRWFELLTHAERLRTNCRENCDLVPVRKILKNMNGFMFKWYMRTIT